MASPILVARGELGRAGDELAGAELGRRGDARCTGATGDAAIGDVGDAGVGGLINDDGRVGIASGVGGVVRSTGTVLAEASGGRGFG